MVVMRKKIVIHNVLATDARKFTHEEVGYGKSTGADRCEVCARHLDNPFRCRLVVDVAPDGWCRLFKDMRDVRESKP